MTPDYDHARSFDAFFELDRSIELKIRTKAQIDEHWNRSDSFYWILTLEGTGYFAESGRSQFLRQGWILAKQGPLGECIKLDEKGRSWRVLFLEARRPFATNRVAYVARQMGSIHKISLQSECVKLARRLVNGNNGDAWKRSLLSFRWFHAWWQETDKHTREVLRFLEATPDEKDAMHHISSLKSLADQLGYSPAYLSQILKRKWKENPAQSLRKKRLEFAARQLRETSIQVGALANELGYLSESAFVRAFRLQHGLPPEKYRKTHAAI